MGIEAANSWDVIHTYQQYSTINVNLSTKKSTFCSTEKTHFSTAGSPSCWRNRRKSGHQANSPGFRQPLGQKEQE